jgi:hypothetical protein
MIFILPQSLSEYALRRINKNLDKSKVHGYTWSEKNILEKYEGGEDVSSFLEWSIDTAEYWVLIDPVEKITVASPGRLERYIDFETLMASTEIQPLLFWEGEKDQY